MAVINEKSKKDEFINKLSQYDRKFIIEIYKDSDINPPDINVPDDFLVEELIKNIKFNDKKVDYIELISEFLDLYSEIKLIPKDILLASIHLKNQDKIPAKTIKDNLIHHYLKLILKNKINIEDFSKSIQNATIISKINKNKNIDNIVVLASKLGEEVNGTMDKAKLINRILFGLKSGKYHPEEVEKHLDNQKSNKVKSSSIKDNLANEVKTIKSQLLSIEKESEFQKNTLKKINITIDNINNSINQNNNIMQSYHNYIKSYFEKTEANFNIGRTEKLIMGLRKEELKIGKIKPGSFDSLKNSLNDNNISDFDILRDGLAVMTMDYLLKLTKETEWKISLDLFYRILYEETINLVNSANNTVKIPSIRKSVTERMNLNSEKFDSLLLSCREKGWVLLEVGTPIGETNAGWLDTGKNRFYYLKLLKK